MKLNNSLFILLLVCLVAPLFSQEQTEDQSLEEEFIRQRAEMGESHASGGRPEFGPVILGNPTQAYTLIRVGLSFSTLNLNGTIANEFATRHFAAAEISHTVGTVHLINAATGKQIVDLDVPGTIVRVTRDDATGYHVSIGGVETGVYAGPLVFRPTDPTNLFRIENIRRSFSGTFVPSYRGTIELSHGSGTPASKKSANAITTPQATSLIAVASTRFST